jgi:hypothetical protein
MAAPKGNTFGARAQRLWRDTLLRKCAQDPNALERIALKVISMAEEGDMRAVKEIGDRLDGLPTQEVNVSDSKNPRDLSDAELIDVIRQQTARRDASKQLN